MKILIIGGGNMGATYAQSFLRSHISNREDLMILEKSKAKADELSQKDIGQVFSDPQECLPQADLIIIAVKPQDAHQLFEWIKPLVQPQQLFLSIMAGVQVHSIAMELDVRKIVRAMPNLPAQTGMGMTAFTSTDEVTRIELITVQNLLNTTGKTIYVENESLIDAATAISGSGPAYVYYFMNSMIRAAIEMGFSHSEAEMLVGQTFRGAIDVYIKSDFSCEEWIQKVASRGGTTEAALKVFSSKILDQSIIEGAHAALERAIELGKEA